MKKTIYAIILITFLAAISTGCETMDPHHDSKDMPSSQGGCH